MKNQLLFLILTSLSFTCYAQISFEKGYYINNADQKVDCLIKNMDWNNNPTEFEYKQLENAEKKRATIKTVREFGIYNVFKYVRTGVQIDMSSEGMNELSIEKKPLFEEKELFLKVLVEGKSNLYEYVDGNLRRYFYNKVNASIEQLIYKTYKHAQDKVAKNNRYKQQLWNNLKCPTFTIKKVENVAYKKNDLVRFFIAYNECNSHQFTNYETKPIRDFFNLSIRPGLTNSSLAIKNSLENSRNTDFGTKLGFRFGIEAEFVMPINKNKWAILLEPTYQYYKSAKELTSQPIVADYKSIELPVGIRHYFFLNDHAKIFINGSLIFDFSGNSVITYNSRPYLDIATKHNSAFGLGYKHDRYSLELRYQTSRELLRKHIYWSSTYTTFSVLVGYSVF